MKKERPLKRRRIGARKCEFVAYDLETTRIAEGTPELLYITAYSEDFVYSNPIIGKDRLETLYQILDTHFFTPQNNKRRFIAWNANNFDVYFIAQAVLKSDKWQLRPYLTRSKSMRGLRVMDKEQPNKIFFEFLDGVAMTGLHGKKLKWFVDMFAPDYPKLDLDFDQTEFDYTNPDHVAYAERDSEALYYAMKEVNRIVVELTGNDLQPTIGNLAIKFLMSKIPDSVLIWKPPPDVYDALHGSLKRGGYCWVQRQYDGPVWKYDLNQAYAAAMRDCKLPSGRCVHTWEYQPGLCGVYRCYVGRGVQSEIPFYYRTIDKHIGAFTAGAYVETWLTTIEIEHLIRDGWLVEIIEGSYWEEYFCLADMVNELEALRFSDPGGPNGPLGTMVKFIGNNAYGKTLERLDGLEIIMALDCPPGFISYQAENPEMDHVWCMMKDPYPRDYHKPQIGVFITAHVRMLVREAALQCAGAFLYADTDCVVFSESVDFLDVDPKRYGAWKQETNGERAIIIGKKVYYCEKDEQKKAKGLIIKKLEKQDFEEWFTGRLPIQTQLQRQNFVKFMSGSDMFRDSERTGTDVAQSQQSHLIKGRFYPVTL